MATVIYTRTGKESLLLSQGEYDLLILYAQKNGKELSDIGFLEALCVVNFISWPIPDCRVVTNTSR